MLAALGQRYEILGAAGHGSMGNVYKARDRETGETVALKLLKPEIASDRAMMDRFKNELLYARKITHKNVCRVYEFNRLGNIAYTSMEFVEGESLRSVLNRFGALSQKKATDLALQICSGLKEAHAQGIVHRDLKPENVMIDGNGNLKLMDFGIARSMQALTQHSGSMVGTPAYMAPEQVVGAPVDYRTDIYSLGLMLYEMFTGKPAFTAENAVAVALKQMREEPPRPSEVEPSVPVAMERAILKCLEKAPARRFQTVAELEAAVQAHAAGTHPRTGVTAADAAAGAARVVSATTRGMAQAPARATQSALVQAPVPAGAPAKVSNNSSSALWAVLIALFLVSCAGANLYWRSAMNSTANIPGPAAAPAPVPPDFAYEIPAPASGTPPAGPAAGLATERVAANPTPPATRAKPEANSNANTKSGSGPAASATKREVFPKMETSPRERALPDPSKWIAEHNAYAKQAKQGKHAKAPEMVYLKAGMFLREERARETVKKIHELGFPATVKVIPAGKGNVYIALCGPLAAGGAKVVTQQLKADGFKGVQQVSAETAQ